MCLHQGFFLLMIAGFTNTLYHYLNLLYCIFLGQFNGWCNHIIQAERVAATDTYQVHMMIVMMALSAFVFAERILNAVIGCWNGVDDAFVNKGLQRTVNGYPVKMIVGVFFNICMGQGAIAAQE